MAEASPFRPERILAALERHGVEYVLIGGLAATLHGAAHLTTDVDITPKEDPDNLARLSDALRELGARVRSGQGAAEALPFAHDAASLAKARIWNLTTEAGDLDITFVPSGTQGYEDLRRDAVTIRVRGVQVPLASLADVIRSKEAADRPRDRAALPGLRTLLEHQRGGSA